MKTYDHIKWYKEELLSKIESDSYNGFKHNCYNVYYINNILRYGGGLYRAFKIPFGPPVDLFPYSNSFLSRNEPTKEDFEKFKFKVKTPYYFQREYHPVQIKDAVIRFGLNPKTNQFSKIGKIVEFIFQDNSSYKLHGRKLPGQPTTKELFKYKNRYSKKHPDSEDDISEIVNDGLAELRAMIEEGATFDWMY